MPTKSQREYYRMGYSDGLADARRDITRDFGLEKLGERGPTGKYYKEYTEMDIKGRDMPTARRRRPTRRLNAWQKFVKVNSKKKQFRYRDGKVNLKKLGIAYRKKTRR